MEQLEQQQEDGDVGDGGGVGGNALLKKGPWTAAEDAILVAYVQKHGEGNWNSLQKQSGLLRCGKSCRLRWANHLRPNLKKGAFSMEEERLIIELHAKLGNKWARMAAQLPGRTDNEIKNYWNTRIKRRQRAGLPVYPPDLQNTSLHSSCLPGQSDSTSLGSSVDSDCDIVPSPRTEFHSLNFTSLPNETVNCSLPTGIGEYALDNLPSDYLNIPTTFSGNHLHNLKRPASSLGYSGEYEEIPFSQISDESSEGMQPNVRAKRTCLISSLAQGFPLEPDPDIGSLFSNFASGDHAFLDGFYSCFGLDSSLKLELPSGQCVEEADNAGLFTPALSSPFTTLTLSKSVVLDPAFDSASNNGLLESLLQESKAKGRNVKLTMQPKEQTSIQASNDFSVSSESKNPVTGYKVSTASPSYNWKHESCALNAGLDSTSANPSYNLKHEISNRLAPALRPIIKVEESSGALSCIYPNMEPSSISNFVRPDVILISEWNHMQCHTADTDTLAWPRETQPQSDFVSVVNEGSSGHLGYMPTVAGHFWELGSCQWNNMPGACQIGDFASDFRHFTSTPEQSGDPCAIF
ncbi:hypothetical protein O6H91_Y037400 [Diphasiastrum complanatum]|nr:hypothetical protein O6H91_Y037400 [Diphasiastrum complanatum]